MGGIFGGEHRDKIHERTDERTNTVANERSACLRAARRFASFSL